MHVTASGNLLSCFSNVVLAVQIGNMKKLETLLSTLMVDWKNK